MYSRIVECKVNTAQLDKFRSTLSGEVRQLLRNAQGFVDVLETLDTSTGDFVCVSLWNSKESADRFGREGFQKVAELLVPLAATEPTVRTIPVETSTAHRISIGEAAAA
jgi:quinol monooxygenase YgiN